MAGKPIYAAGLDAGSRSTRLVICVLENSRIRYAGASEVESQGWAKGRIVDQQAVSESIGAALREANCPAAAGLAVRGGRHGRSHGARRQRPRRARTRLHAGDRAARRAARDRARLARATAGRPHGAAALPAGFRGGRPSRPPRPAQDAGVAPGNQRPPGDGIGAGAQRDGRRGQRGPPGGGRDRCSKRWRRATRRCFRRTGAKASRWWISARNPPNWWCTTATPCTWRPPCASAATTSRATWRRACA